MDRVYCYPDSNVLKNKMNVQDAEQLHLLEKRLTMLRIFELIDHPLPGKFDFQHLLSIHGYIFQDIYDWAGKVRKVEIAKGNMFCSVRFIEEQAADIFGKLRREHYLQGLNRKDTARRLAYYFSEINALHPFREGNGRSQREFIRLLALRLGYVMHFSEMPRAEMLRASKASFLCEYGRMEEVFLKGLRERE